MLIGRWLDVSFATNGAENLDVSYTRNALSEVKYSHPRPRHSMEECTFYTTINKYGQGLKAQLAFFIVASLIYRGEAL